MASAVALSSVHGRALKCSKGKLLPQLLVIGSQACLTSFLAGNLRLTGVAFRGGAPSDTPSKKTCEDNFFDCSMGRGHSQAAKASRAAEDQKKWWRKKYLAQLPDCNTSKYGSVVLADTANYDMALTVGNESGDMLSSGIAHKLPTMVLAAFGSGSQHISLVFVLREPLSQVESAMYEARALGNFNQICRDCSRMSFRSALQVALINASVRHDRVDTVPWFWSTMYARILQAWLQYFGAWQMTVVPAGDVHQRMHRICNSLSRNYMGNLDCTGLMDSAVLKSPTCHESDSSWLLSETLRRKFHLLLKGEMLRLANLLTEMYIKGAELHGYFGGPSNRTIKEWLEENW